MTTKAAEHAGQASSRSALTPESPGNFISIYLHCKRKSEYPVERTCKVQCKAFDRKVHSNQHLIGARHQHTVLYTLILLSLTSGSHSFLWWTTFLPALHFTFKNFIFTVDFIISAAVFFSAGLRH